MTLLNDLTRPVPDSGAIAHAVASDPLWYKDAIIYQLHVKAFFDADNDGMAISKDCAASWIICRISGSRHYGSCRFTVAVAR